jgi:hypothetical protein
MAEPVGTCFIFFSTISFLSLVHRLHVLVVVVHLGRVVASPYVNRRYYIVRALCFVLNWASVVHISDLHDGNNSQKQLRTKTGSSQDGLHNGHNEHNVHSLSTDALRNESGLDRHFIGNLISYAHLSSFIHCYSKSTSQIIPNR